jgi:RNA polymerase sigma-70 factor (family 1)
MPLCKLFYSQQSDADLFLLVKQNDAKAFEELFNRYWSGLVNAAYKRLNSREQAEDIVQNIFLDLYRRRTSIELTISLKAYLSQALRYKVLNEYRSDLISSKRQQYLFLNLPCKNGFASCLEAKDLEKQIDTILKGLPGKCRQVFLLSRKENLSNRDISASLNITVSSVEKHITRALKTLRNCQIYN